LELAFAIFEPAGSGVAAGAAADAAAPSSASITSTSSSGFSALALVALDRAGDLLRGAFAGDFAGALAADLAGDFLAATDSLAGDLDALTGDFAGGIPGSQSNLQTSSDEAPGQQQNSELGAASGPVPDSTMSKRPTGVLNAQKKKILKEKFKYKLVRVTPEFEVEDLTPAQLDVFERRHPTIAARWIHGEDAPVSWQQQCQRILKGLMSGKIAAPFTAPVDPVKLNLPTYFQIVKKPMDLGA
jgi:hypothetical protein